MNINITRQAQVILLLGIIQFLIIILYAPKEILTIFTIFVVLILGTCVNAYSVNCMVIGNCDTFAWVMVGITVIWVFSLLISSVKKDKEKYSLTN
jgi:hypothetical protein